MLISTGDNVLNTAAIKSVSPAGPNMKGTRVQFIDGGAQTIDCDISHFERVCGAIIPAPPGFTLIEAVIPGEGEPDAKIIYRKSTVLAFRIGSHETPYPMPISAEGEPCGGSEPFTVLEPNGTCSGPDGWCENFEAFQALCEGMRAPRPE